MSNTTNETTKIPVKRQKIRVRVEKLRKARQWNSVGFAELMGLAGSAILLLAVLFTYLYFYNPAQTRIATAQRERARLQEKLSTLQKDLDVKGTAQDSVTKISDSLVTFETDRLTSREEGRITLYNALIKLIGNNKLRNTSGPSYTYLDAKAPSKTQGPRLGTARLQSLYPGIGVSVTVEGQYANLRHFVRDIESSSQFIVINAVELERASESGSATGLPGAAARATLVSLKIDMAAYFQRESSEASGEAAPANEAR